MQMSQESRRMAHRGAETLEAGGRREKVRDRTHRRPGSCGGGDPVILWPGQTTSPVSLRKTQDWLSEPQMPPPVACGSQGSWANKIRCYFF